MDEKNAARWALFTRNERENIRNIIVESADEWNDGDLGVMEDIVEEIDYINGQERR